jgi:hypothetical protein
MASRRKQSKPKAFGLNESELDDANATSSGIAVETATASVVENLNKPDAINSEIKVDNSDDQIMTSEQEEVVNTVNIPSETVIILEDCSSAISPTTEVNTINERKRKRPSEDSDYEVLNGNTGVDADDLVPSLNSKNPNLELANIDVVEKRQEAHEVNKVNI